MPSEQPSSFLTPENVIAATRIWVENAVIGLNLCPFAKAVQVKNQVRYVVSQATEPEALGADLLKELIFLDERAPASVDTTLLIHPYVLTDFLDYNDFLSVADDILARQGLEGVVQIASFHPEYQFADASAHAIENYTNRSPFPILHLLREDSIERAVDAIPDASLIYERNMDVLRTLGKAGWQALEKAWLDELAGLKR